MIIKKYPLTIPYILNKEVKPLDIPLFKKYPLCNFLDFILTTGSYTKYWFGTIIELIT